MFAEAGRAFDERAKAVSRRFERVPLELSFRTVSPLLTAVDHVFANPSETPGLTSAQEAVRRCPAVALSERGHDVTWISGPPVAPLVERARIGFAAVDETGWRWPPPPR